MSEPWQGAHQRAGRWRNRIIVKYLSQWLIELGPPCRRSHALHCLHTDTSVSARVLLSCHHSSFSRPKTMMAWRSGIDKLRDARIVCVTACAGGSVRGWKGFRMVHLQLTFDRRLWHLLITDPAYLHENMHLCFWKSSKNCELGIILNIHWYQYIKWLDQCIFSNGKTRAPNFACPLAVVHNNTFSSPHSMDILVHNTRQEEME